MNKKILVLILAYLMNFFVIEAAIVNGICGDNLTWTLNTQDSTLVIEGSGEMTSTPWGTYNSYIAYASLPSGLTNIGNSAFENSKDLTVIDIPSSVVKIGNRAFFGCEKLSSILIPSGTLYIGDYAFMCCRAITSISIPENVSYVGRQAFTSCTNLQHAVFNNTIENIGDAAFSNCQNLQSVLLPNGLTEIKGSTFSDCYKLSSIILPNTITKIGGTSFLNCNNLVSVVIPDSVISIGYRAFARCSSLQSIVIGENVESFGDAVFEGCTSLSSVIWNATNCNNFKSGSSPFSFYIIGTYDSQYNYSISNQITSFSFGVKVSHIPAYLLNGTTSLKTISIPESVKSIGKDAFSGSALKSVVVPDSVTSIGEYAFYSCTELANVTIGKSITNIGNNIFNGCPINRISVFASIPPDGGLNSGIVNTSCKLYVPEESVEVYANTIWWEDFASIRAFGSMPIVRFLDWNGVELSSQEVEEGESAIAPSNPTREGYTFIGWDADFSNVTEDLIVTAIYKINRYKVDFIDWDNSVLKSDSVDWNTAAIAPENPTRSGYTFVGWDKDFTIIDSDLIVRAQYELGEHTTFTIVFSNGNDHSEILSHYTILNVPAAPEIDGFTFLGWQPLATIIKNNTIVIEAIYQANDQMSAPEVYTNPINPAQKLIRNGNVYILSGDKTYTLQGHEVK